MVRFRPGKLAYLSESDSEVEVEKEKTEPRKQCAASSKRGSPRTPALSNCQNSKVRSSERIRRKQSQSFEKPTRQQIMSKIDTLKSPSKMLDRLKPRRLVNDFTKETHRYNYDPVYTSGESSIDDFIDDDNEDPGSNACSSSEESSVAEEMPSPVPLKKNISSDDDETPTKGKKSNVAKRKLTKTNVKGAKFTRIKVRGAKDSEETPSSSEDEQLNISSVSWATKTSVSKENLSDSNDDIVNSSKKNRAILSSSDGDSSGSDVVQPGQHRNLKRRQESAETESPQPSNNDNSTMATRHGTKRKLCMLSESSEASEASDANTDNEIENTSDSTDEESEDDDDENDSGSEVNKRSSLHNKISSRYGHLHSHRAKLMQHRRDKKRRLLTKLTEARKRKNSTGNLSAV